VIVSGPSGSDGCGCASSNNLAVGTFVTEGIGDSDSDEGCDKDNADLGHFGAK